MTAEKKYFAVPEPPRENFARGLAGVEIPELGTAIHGKVRDNWVVARNGERIRVMVTTDRQSAFDQDVCTVPGKGQVLNLTSAHEFERTRLVVPNHMIIVPHPNVLIAKQASATLPVEIIVRDFIARSSTTTSIYHHYFNLEERTIYGIKFPDGLLPNQKLPEEMSSIITPTTKALSGIHDAVLTNEEARNIVDSRFGKDTYSKAQIAALALFRSGVKYFGEKGLILVDTKYEFGIDENGNLMAIDEMHTPDSSRLWLAKTYRQKFLEGENPESFDKEILRRWLADNGFTGDGSVLVVPSEIIDQMAEAYKIPYEMITGERLPQDPQSSDPDSIRQAVLGYFRNLKS